MLGTKWIDRAKKWIQDFLKQASGTFITLAALIGGLLGLDWLTADNIQFVIDQINTTTVAVLGAIGIAISGINEFIQRFFGDAEAEKIEKVAVDSKKIHTTE